LSDALDTALAGNPRAPEFSISVSTVPPDSEDAPQPAEPVRSDLHDELDDLRDELGEALRSFEGRLRGLSRQTPEWSVVGPDDIRELFDLPIDGSYEEARLGPRAVAVAAAELERFIDHWLADEPPESSPDATQLREFSDDAHAFVETLEVIGTTARRRADHAHRRLDDWRDSSFAELNELRESDIEAIQDLIEEGDLESGHDARLERATVWEEQRDRAAELTDYATTLHNLLEEGRDRTVAGLRGLADLFNRTCDALESIHPELADYRPINPDDIADTDRAADTIVAPTDILDDAVDASRRHEPETPSNSSPASDSASKAADDIDGDPSDRDSSMPDDTIAENGAPTRPDAQTPHEEEVAPGADNHAASPEMVRADASSSSSRPFLRTPPPERSHDETDDAETADDARERRTPTRDHETSHELPRRHDSTFVDASDGRSASDDSDTGHGLGLESSSDLQHDGDDDRSSADTSSSLRIQLDQTSGDDDLEAGASDSNHAFVRGGDDNATAPTDADSSSSQQRDERRTDDNRDNASRGTEGTLAPSRPIDSPVAAHATRFRAEWRRIPLTAVFAAIGIPALFVTVVTLLGVLHVTGGSIAPNPVRTWPWLESASVVSILWIAAAPLLLGWRVRWRGWRCDLIRRSELREEAQLRLDNDGLLIHDISFPWRDLSGAARFRFETADGTRGWLLRIQTEHTADIALVAPVDDDDAWTTTDIPRRSPPPDAWQIDTTTCRDLARYLDPSG